MEKRYQVFLSSTFADLQAEREEVIQALLELGCIPSGMELFPAANLDQWSLIKKVIDDCDYYIVVVAGRYGSLGPEKISFTEMEYRYAVAQGKPVIGFLHQNPSNIIAARCESTELGKESLSKFRALVQEKPCRFWDSPADLGSKVSRSLMLLIKDHPAVGWVRGDLVPAESTATEILALRKKVEGLEAALQSARIAAPKDTDGLAQGEDEFEVEFSFVASPNKFPAHGTDEWSMERLSWNDIFSTVAPLMIDEASEPEMRRALDAQVELYSYGRIASLERFKGLFLLAFKVDDDNFQTIKVQLRALGLIAKSTKARSVKNSATYWTLTPYGDAVMNRLIAIPRRARSKTKSSDSEATVSPSEVGERSMTDGT